MFILKIKNKTILNIFFLCICCSVINANVVINEYSASNLTGYVDNYSLEEDWIELYNTSDQGIDLGGYHLSDESDEPMKWMIPSGTIIPANGYKTFWCSG